MGTLARFGRLATVLLGFSWLMPAQQIAMGEYAVPTLNAFSFGITVGPDGALWFTEYDSDRIGRITTAGAITEFAVPTPGSSPQGITAGPDGALWFTEFFGNQIGRITTGGAVTEYPLPTQHSAPSFIAAGADGALWFTEAEGIGQIGRITTSGAITEYPLPHSGSNPIGITAGPDEALWFVEGSGDRIGRITTGGVITEYTIPTLHTNPYGIAVGPDGALWFTETATGQIGRMTPGGVFTEFPGSSEPVLITAGPDGALWFTQGFYTQIGRITTTGVVTNYPLPRQGAPTLNGITTGPDGELWFANGVYGIGEIVFETASLSVSPVQAVCGANLTFSGSGFAPGENVRIYRSGVGSVVIAAATTDASGSLTVMARAPQSVYGARLFLGIGQTSGKLGAAAFSIDPRIILQPNSGTPGATVTAEGCGFGTNEPVKLYWHNPRSLLGTAVADVHGTFEAGAAITFTVPPSALSGAHVVVGIGVTSGAKGHGVFDVE